MNLCSAIVHAREQKAVQVSEKLQMFPGVEVHGGANEGRLIVTVEGTADDALADTLNQFNDVDGVISTVMIYHYCGEDAANEEVLQ